MGGAPVLGALEHGARPGRRVGLKMGRQVGVSLGPDGGHGLATPRPTPRPDPRHNSISTRIVRAGARGPRPRGRVHPYCGCKPVDTYQSP